MIRRVLVQTDSRPPEIELPNYDMAEIIQRMLIDIVNMAKNVNALKEIRSLKFIFSDKEIFLQGEE